MEEKLFPVNPSRFFPLEDGAGVTREFPLGKHEIKLFLSGRGNVVDKMTVDRDDSPIIDLTNTTADVANHAWENFTRWL